MSSLQTLPPELFEKILNTDIPLLEIYRQCQEFLKVKIWQQSCENESFWQAVARSYLPEDFYKSLVELDLPIGQIFREMARFLFLLEQTILDQGFVYLFLEDASKNNLKPEIPALVNKYYQMAFLDESLLDEDIIVNVEDAHLSLSKIISGEYFLNGISKLSNDQMNGLSSQTFSEKELVIVLLVIILFAKEKKLELPTEEPSQLAGSFERIKKLMS